MKISKEHQDFLEEMEINIERINALQLDPQILIEIADDYENSKEDLLDSAEHIAKKIQRCAQVHSVRWRIKDTSHLIEKIIRKKEEKNEKYSEINLSNYKTIITDLIGVRAIYLFKHEWLNIHNYIISKWKPSQKVIIYHRIGDELEQYKERPECKIEEHKSGYRSIHYIINAGEIGSDLLSCEIQTRTIFEEGWSEIDHTVRYPKFINPTLEGFLYTFNRLSGSADEMGTFVIELKGLIKSEAQAKEEMQIHQSKIEQLENKIDILIEQVKDHKELKQAFNELKHASNAINKDIIEHRHRVANDPRERRRLAKMALLLAQSIQE